MVQLQQLELLIHHRNCRIHCSYHRHSSCFCSMHDDRIVLLVEAYVSSCSSLQAHSKKVQVHSMQLLEHSMMLLEHSMQLQVHSMKLQVHSKMALQHIHCCNICYVRRGSSEHLKGYDVSCSSLQAHSKKVLVHSKQVLVHSKQVLVHSK